MSEGEDKVFDGPPAEGIVKLLDRGYVVSLYRNGLLTYTAAAFTPGTATAAAVLVGVGAMDDMAPEHTDGITPAAALEALSEKMLRTGWYANWPKGPASVP